jgi:hypothetical protein
VTATSALPFESRTIVRNRQRVLSTSHAARPLLASSLASLSTADVERQWFLPHTTVADELTHYRSRYAAHHTGGPIPRLRDHRQGARPDTALAIRAALSFLDSAQTSDPFVRPIALYYASAHLFGALTRAFFEWENDKRTHGLRFVGVKGKDVDRTKVVVTETGHFPRLALTCFLLWGTPSCFDPIVAYSTKPCTPIVPDQILETFGNEERGPLVSELTLLELANFDFSGHAERMKQRFGLQKYNGVASNGFLRDAIALFAASMIARYRIQQWQSILEGTRNSYRVFFEAVFDRFVDFTIDRVLLILENPRKTFEDAIGYVMPSPFASHILPTT